MGFILEDIHKSLKKHQVLKGADMVFESGHIIGFLGRDGAGKTTLFQILNGELPLDSGNFYIEEGDQRQPVQEGNIDLIYSENILPNFLTGYELIKFYLDIYRGRENIDPDPFLDQMEFSQKDRHKLIKTYSHGMKTKLSMLILLIATPPVMLLSEPLTSLDIVMSEMTKNILWTMQKGHIIILSTHMMGLAKNLRDEIVPLHNDRPKGVEDTGQGDSDACILQTLREKEDA